MAKMAERFGKAKRVDRDLPGASSQGGGDFSGQKCSRGPGDNHLAAASIEESPYEAFPAQHDLDLVKAPGNVKLSSCQGDKSLDDEATSSCGQPLGAKLRDASSTPHNNRWYRCHHEAKRWTTD